MNNERVIKKGNRMEHMGDCLLPTMLPTVAHHSGIRLAVSLLDFLPMLLPLPLVDGCCYNNVAAAVAVTACCIALLYSSMLLPLPLPLLILLLALVSRRHGH